MLETKCDELRHIHEQILMHKMVESPGENVTFPFVPDFPYFLGVLTL
jgi:hypothetical protein